LRGVAYLLKTGNEVAIGFHCGRDLLLCRIMQTNAAISCYELAEL
jgi:hypothetical protein